jgi:hypothetical protein
VHQLTAELQGHSIKNKDLLAASGAITLRGTDSYDALAEDEEAVSGVSDLPPDVEHQAEDGAAERFAES